MKARDKRKRRKARLARRWLTTLMRRAMRGTVQSMKRHLRTALWGTSCSSWRLDEATWQLRQAWRAEQWQRVALA